MLCGDAIGKKNGCNSFLMEKKNINLKEHFNKETPCHHLFSLEKEKNVASCAESIIFLQRRDEKV